MKYQDALLALRTGGYRYRLHPQHYERDVWIAPCPKCVAEIGDRTEHLTLYGSANGNVTGGCRHCGRVALVWLAAILQPPSTSERLRRLELRAQTAEYQNSVLSAKLSSLAARIGKLEKAAGE